MKYQEERQFNQIYYTLVRNTVQKNMRMHFNDYGDLIVSVPFRTPQSSIDAFIEDKTEWINKHKGVPEHDFSPEDRIQFLGYLSSIEITQGWKASASYVPGVIFITVPFPNDKDDIEEQLYYLFAYTIRDFIKKNSKMWESRLGVKPASYRIGTGKTRWGCCNCKTRVITISAIAASLPEDLIEMILVHELCHLVHPNHQEDFHALLKTHIPDIDEREARLKEYSRSKAHRNLF